MEQGKRHTGVAPDFYAAKEKYKDSALIARPW